MCMIISKKFEIAPAVFRQNFTDLFGYSYYLYACLLSIYLCIIRFEV